MTKHSLSSSLCHSEALLTDLYQLTMAHGYWKAGFEEAEACFHLFFRHTPFQGGYAINAGLEAVVQFIENFSFTEEDLSYLASLRGNDEKPLFDSGFLEFLVDFQLKIDLDAIPEGSVVFSNEPLLRVQGPLIHCQLLESPLLALVNFPTLIATKASRVCSAAGKDPVIDFGMRRAQGVNGGLTAARASYLGGCSATSNVLAGKLYGIPVKGTHAHSWVQAFSDERKAFNKYAETSGNNCVLLVDTYNTLEGVKKAIETGERLREEGQELLGIRLDSGDLAYLSIQARKLLDESGFQQTKIIASNELDEHVISELRRQGARIDIWGVGTHLVTGFDQPALDGVYKISAIRRPGEEWSDTLKLSEQMIKVSNPGILQVRRYFKNEGNCADVIFDERHEPIGKCTVRDPLDATRSKQLSISLQYRDLLEPIFRKGRRIYTLPSLQEVRNRCRSELAMFHNGIKRFLNPHQYVVGIEEGLYQRKIDLIRQIRSREMAGHTL